MRWPGLCAAVAVAVSASALAGCGSSGSSHAAGAADVGGATGSGAGSCGYAFVFLDPIASNTAEQTQYRGIQEAEKNLHITVNVVQANGTPTPGYFADLAAKGCYKAIGTSFFEYSDAINEVAKEYPKQKFFIWQGSSSEPNVVAYNTDDEEGTYVAGAMAAAMSKTHVLGIILGTSALAPWSTGFVAGAHLIDPATKVLTEYVGSFSDPTQTGAIAVTLAGRGADLIYSASGANLQTYLLGAAHHYETIASDMTEYGEASPRHAAVAFIAAEAEDTVVYDMLKQFATNTVSSDNVLLGLNQGIYTIPYITGPATSAYTLSPQVIAAGKRAYQMVISGQVKF